MFSSLTHHGAQATLDALEAGALDFLPKKFEDIAQTEKTHRMLCTKVRLIARRGIGLKRPSFRSTEAKLPDAPKQAFFKTSGLLSGHKDAAKQPTVSSVRATGKHYKCLAIGASTGGRGASKSAVSLPAEFPYPFCLYNTCLEHLLRLAQRLDTNCKIRVKEAEHGDILKPGHAYLAPGGKQMLLETIGANKRIALLTQMRRQGEL